jgi:hypothetical protein
MPNFLCINSHVQDTGQENEWESIGEPRKPEDYVFVLISNSSVFNQARKGLSSHGQVDKQE